MLENIDNLGGLVFSQQVLLALIEKGLSREKSYEIVQKKAMKVWETPIKDRKDLFMNLLISDKEILKNISINEIKNIFKINYHTKNVDFILKKVLKD